MNSHFAVNNLGAIMNLVAMGEGIHLAPRWYLDGPGKDLELVEVLADWKTDAFPVHALYLASDIGFTPAKIRVFIDKLVNQISHLGWP